MLNFRDIFTERLVLRKLKPEDALDFFRYRSSPEVCEFQTFKPEDIKDVEGFFSTISELPDICNTWFQLAVTKKDNGKLIGDIGIHFVDDDQAEIGYTVSPEYQGNGYAKEAAAAIMNYLFMDLSKHRVFASVDPENIRSVRLLEKIGMRKEAHFIKSIKVNDTWTDDCIYAILKEEWIEMGPEGGDRG